jgi:hypothetical protein
MFVEEFTRVHGEAPKLWDGCAEVMGNSVPTWNKHYHISKSNRGAAAAISAHVNARFGHGSGSSSRDGTRTLPSRLHIHNSGGHEEDEETMSDDQ